MRLTALLPEPLTATPTKPAPRATDPENTDESMDCRLSAITLKFSVLLGSSSAMIEDLVTLASIWLAAVAVSCFHSLVSA